MMLPESGTRKGVGRSRSQRRKSEVMCSRSRSGRPYPLRQAPSPQDFPFPLDLYPIARQEGIQREKVWSCPVRQDRAVHRRSEACMAGAQLASLPWLTVDSFGLPPPFPVRQDRAVHRRSEACMAGAQLASLPWLTVDSFGLPPPFPPPFSFGCS